MPELKKIAVHKGCGGVIGWDAWADSEGEVCGGPYDSSQCMKCGAANPEQENVGDP
jgi:hypothetical protein